MDLLNEFIRNGDETVLKNLDKYIYDTNKNDTKYWDFIISNTILDKDKIIKNLEYIDINILIEKQPLSSELLLNDNIWDQIKENKLNNLIIKHQKLKYDVIEKLLNDFNDNNWIDLCTYQNLSINIMEEYKEYIIWDIISENQFMTFEFIYDNKKLINWSLLCKNIKIEYLLNETFISLFEDYDIWNILIWSKNITEAYIIDHLHKLSNEQILELLEIRNLNESTIMKIIELYPNIDDIYIVISENQNLSIEFIQDNINLLDINEIVQNQNITFDFIIQNKDNISLKSLSYNDYLNEDLFIKIYNIIDTFDDTFDWEYISEYVDISKDNIKLIKELDKSKLIQKKITE
jgi:hypothetical protein